MVNVLSPIQTRHGHPLHCGTLHRSGRLIPDHPNVGKIYIKKIVLNRYDSRRYILDIQTLFPNELYAHHYKSIILSLSDHRFHLTIFSDDRIHFIPLAFHICNQF